jgi:hypothetical protein
VSYRLRRLNDEGVRRFADYLAGGAEGFSPIDLLDNPETSDALPVPVSLGSGRFNDRFEFGIYLKTLFKNHNAAALGSDRNLWTSMALYWFEQLCPLKSGTRDVGEEYRYILSGDYRHYYRHLVRSPWHLVQVHGENARILLVAPRKQDYPLSVHGEIMEQLAGRQQVLASRRIIAAANKMYLDPQTLRPRTGVAGSGRGSARRFGIVLRQFDLTYDPEIMPDGGLVAVLPSEFEKWKKSPRENTPSAKLVSAGQSAAPS